jgi:protein TonB
MALAASVESRRLNSPGLVIVVALHAGVITAAMLAKIDVVRQAWTETKVKLIPSDPPNDPKPAPPKAMPKLKMPVTQPKAQIELPNTVAGPIFDPPILPPQVIKFDPPPPPLPLPQIQSARAKGDVRSLITADDYPTSSIRNGETGSVRAQLAIGLDGRVTGCSILDSSGSAALDAATCRVLKSRARFTPARNGDGATVTDSYTTPRITWRLEGEG